MEDRRHCIIGDLMTGGETPHAIQVRVLDATLILPRIATVKRFLGQPRRNFSGTEGA